MVDMNKEREAFEQHLIDTGLVEFAGYGFEVDGCDEYTHEPTNVAWGTWVVGLNRAKVQAVQAWISVKEKLPELETDVLVVFKGNIIQAGLYQGDDGLAWWSELLDGWDLDFERVTHWKPQIILPIQFETEE